MASNTERYRAARDQAFAMVGGTADTFAWPDLTGTFNWATDWFDVIARFDTVSLRRPGALSDETEARAVKISN